MKKHLLITLLIIFQIIVFQHKLYAEDLDSTDAIVNFFKTASENQKILLYLGEKKKRILAEEKVIEIQKIVIEKNNIIIELNNQIKNKDELLIIKTQNLIDLSNSLIEKNNIITDKNNYIEKLLKQKFIFPTFFGEFNLGYNLGSSENVFLHGLKVEAKLNYNFLNFMGIYFSGNYEPNFFSNQFLNFNLSTGVSFFIY